MSMSSPNRKTRLHALESEVKEKLVTFHKMGLMLKEIRNGELYKEDGFDTWRKYCRERWDLTLAEAERKIEEAEAFAAGKMTVPPTSASLSVKR